METDYINVKPSARILKVLGDIEFEDWQCLAELVDNAFDDFTESQLSEVPHSDGFDVSITLPYQATPLTEAEVVVADNGRGMDIGTLNNAVRAGWSSNDPFSKLGLFGMGFNVATARLGRLTRVLSTRAGDTEWTGVEIDLDAIKDDFNVPVIHEPKADMAMHGTRIVISRLDATRAGWLGRNAAAIRNTLGDVYSHVLTEKQYRLVVNGVKVKPRKPCRWGDDRSVTFGSGATAEQIPAYIRVDQSYPPAETCFSCRNWQEPGRGACLECGSPSLALRVRRITGWLGIQRYLHKTEFGVDFFRNGRKILRFDKRLFEWQNPNDPLAAREVEYPVELGQGGRIIGEIHLDHVPVNYQKNAFEWSDRNWRAAMEYLRGRSPLLPKRAQQLGLPPNESPIARLHRGFRRNDPGMRYLVPGDSNGPIHDDTRRWGLKFHEGDAEYATDKKWWDAVLFVERPKGVPAPYADPKNPPTDILVELGLNPAAAEPHRLSPTDSVHAHPGGTSSATVAVETEQQRLARYKTQGRQVPSLSGDFGLVELGASVRLATYELDEPLFDAKGKSTPVLLARQPGNAYMAVIDISHPLFRDFDQDAADLVLVELADHLRTRAENAISMSQAVALLKERHLSDRRIDAASLAGQSRDLLRRLRELMSEAVGENPERAWQFLNPDELVATENALVNESATITLQQARESGEFLLFVPPLVLPRLIEEWPQAFLDGRVFAGNYSSISSAAAKRLIVARLVGYLYDVVRLSTVSLSKPEVVRARMSLKLLASELSVERSNP